jgi:NADH:ubiquinone oxidoreductase subunit 4 (subunit M)
VEEGIEVLLLMLRRVLFVQVRTKAMLLLLGLERRDEWPAAVLLLFLFVVGVAEAKVVSVREAEEETSFF